MCRRGWSGEWRTVREKIYTFKKGERERERERERRMGKEGEGEGSCPLSSGTCNFYTRFITITIIILPAAEWLILAVVPRLPLVVMLLRIHTGRWRLWSCSNTRTSLLGWH